MPEVACDPGALLDMAYRAVPQPDDHVVIGLLFRRELRRIELNRPAFTLRPAGRGGAGIMQYSGHQQTALHMKQGKGIDAIGCLGHLGQRIAGPLGLLNLSAPRLGSPGLSPLAWYSLVPAFSFL